MAAPDQSAPFIRARERTWPAGVLLAGLLVLAAWLRLRGLSFGLPAVYNPDEVSILSRALAFATGDLNPHNFLYPTFFFYVLFAWSGVYFALSWLAGAVPSLAAFQAQFFLDPSGLYLAGRTLGVVCGVASVGALWWWARRLFGDSVALTAALFLAVAPTAVRDAHYIKHDVPATLAVVVAMLAVTRTWPIGAGSQARGALLAGALCGVAFSTHYYTVFLVLPLVLATWWRAAQEAPSRRVPSVMLALLTSAAVFFALSPFLLVEPGTAWRDITANRAIVIDRAGGVAGTRFASLVTYLRMLWQEALGWPVLALAAIGAWSLLRLSRRVALLLLAFPVAFLLFITNTVAASRYLNPMLPFAAVLAALGLHDLVARAALRRRPLAVAALAALAALPAVTDSLRVGAFFRQDDTRTQAQRFIESAIEPGRTVLLQPYSVQLTQSREGLLEALTARLGDPSRASKKFALRLQLDPWPSPAYRVLYLGEGGLDADKIYLRYQDFDGEGGPQVFERLGVHLVVLKGYNTLDPATIPLRQALEAGGRLVASFSPYRPGAEPATRAAIAPFLHNTDTPVDPALERPGPVIDIWTVR